MSLTLQTNQFALGSLGLIDADTLEAISATFSNATFTSSDGNIFNTADGGDPNTIRVNGVNPGDASLSFTATAAYTDKNGQGKTKDLSGFVSVHVDAVVVPDQNVSLTINFGSVQQQ